ncbi:MAG TPA: 3-hydroxyacyl-CoA dehydrogenase NAD-binding domain-containing protein [Azoarcus sp.]|nr:3-hydroxyacyl-CoA dehydrogenase NAD-binding domain-containing protein [Azoarcus sp.]
MNRNGTHMRMEKDWEGLAWLTLDCAGSRVNTLSSAVLRELDEFLDALEADPPSGLIIASAKPGGFVAGADISELEALASPAEARALVQRGSDLFARLAAMPFPTLALIRGHCLGGGLELALACRYRVVVDSPETKLGLPEVQLGILPAWGGIRRLPERVGVARGLDLMLSGRTLTAARAQRYGLADVCVPERVMEQAARRVVMSGRHPARKSVGDWLASSLLRRVVAKKAEKKLAARVRREHYPAPYALLEVWARHDGDALAVPDASPNSIASLVTSPSARGLLRVFRLRERLQQTGRAGGKADIEYVHVVGAGTMGGGIAALCAARGFTVTLQDTSTKAIAQAIGRGVKAYAARHYDDPRTVRAMADRLIPDPDGHGLARADLVVEAIAEDLEAKRTLFEQIVSRVRPDTLLATNTSSLTLEAISEGLGLGERLVGLHFFNPVAKMPLVEVIGGEVADTRAVQRATAFVHALGKLPLPCASRAGFLVNAALAPYMFEAMRCVEDGIDPAGIDAAMRAWGMPMGPIELIDRVGLDIALATGRSLGLEPIPSRLAERVEAGALGAKSGRGYYVWKDGKPDKADTPPVPPGLAERLNAPLVHAARECVAAEVVADADLADAGLVFGAGYPPFTGGPLNAANTAPDQPGKEA